MKKFLGILLTTTMFLTLIIIPSTLVTAEEFVDGVWNFTVEGTEATITLYSGTESTATIPSTVSDGTNSYTVTAIGTTSGSVSIDDKNAVKLVNITLPDTIKTIKDKAFFGRGKNATINFPEGLETIGFAAFYNSGADGALRELVFPSTLKSIGRRAFYSCSNIQSITFKSQAAPAIENAGGKEAFWAVSKNAKVYYPADGTGYDDANWRYFFSSANAAPAEGTSALTFEAIGGQPVENGIQAVNLTGGDTVAAATAVESVSIADSDATPGALIVAFYTADMNLLDITSVVVAAEAYQDGMALIHIGHDIPEGCETMKVMFWNNLQDIQPIFEAITK